MATHHTEHHTPAHHAAPHHAAQHHGARPKASAGDPGYGLGLAGFITSFFASVVGLVLSAIALSQSKRAGFSNTLALAGLIIGIVMTALTVLWFAAIIVGAVLFTNYCNDNPNNCQESGYTSPGYDYGPQDDRTF